MPEKRVQEMNQRERSYHSLSSKLFLSTFLTWIVAGLLALAVGLLLYTTALIRENVVTAYNISRGAAISATRGTEAADMMEEIWKRYQGLSEAEKAKMGTPEYEAIFADIQNTEVHRETREMFSTLVKLYDVYDIYIAMYDRERQVVVYAVDPDEDEMKAGGWEPAVSKREVDRFLDWDGEGILYDVGRSREYGWMCTAGTPLLNGAGERVGFVLVDLSMTDVLKDILNYVKAFSVCVLLINLWATFISVRRQRKQVIEPIDAITEAAVAYSADHRSGTAITKHFSRLDIRTGDEIENLGKVMADMEQDISAYTENLASVTAENERVITELNMAANIQAHMLPSTFPAFPERPEFDVFATMHPAKEVGGDFYDFFMLDEDHLAVLMADVSGKGIPAALFMMTVRTMLRGVAQAGLTPAAVLDYVNAQICDNNPEYMFVTVWLGYLELSTGKLVYADAGHEPLLLFQNGVWRMLPRSGGIALGFLEPEFLEEDPPFRDQELLLKPGDAVFQYTDGVTEAMTAELEQFGEQRLVDTLNASPAAEPEALLPYVQGQVEAFVGQAPQFDDITMLALRYHGLDAREKSGENEKNKAPGRADG